MRLVRFAVLALVLPVIGLAVPHQAQAQALPTASKLAAITAFGGYMGSRPDYGPTIKEGFAGGVDFSVYPRLPLTLALEARASEAKGTDITEKAVFFGLRAGKTLRNRYTVYGDALIGGGQITYHPSPFPDYTGDRSKAYSFGGGVDIDAGRHFGIKLDLQDQNWNFGTNGYTKPDGGDYTLAPVTAIIGVTYTIPFRVFNRREDFR